MVFRWFAHLACTVAAASALMAQPSPAQPAAPTSAIASQFDTAAAESEIKSIMARERIPGAQAVVIARDGEIWRTAQGLADRERQRVMTASTLVQIGSVTKIFTASLIADSIARGELGWTDTLGKIFPDLPMKPEIAAISIADLASHTSRLPKDPPNRIDVDGTWRPYMRSELHAALTDPALKLGARDWEYSNFGFAILGHVIEQVTGKTYEAVLRDRLLAPLGMTSTTIALTAAQESELAVHYWPEDNPLKPRQRWRFGEVAGFGGITSTAGDLAKFLAYQMNPRKQPQVLNPDAVIGMRPVRFLFPDWSVGFARPWIVRRDAAGTIILEHAGEVDGHSAKIMFTPTHGVGVAVTADLGQDGAEKIADALFARAVALAKVQPKPAN